MIEDENLSREMIKDVENCFEKNCTHWCKYRLSICAYPNEKYVTVDLYLKEYPQGYKYEISRDFKFSTESYYKRFYPNWEININIL